MGQSKKRFALLLGFPAVIALAVMMIAATGAGAASKRVSPTARGAKSSASSASAHGVRAPSGTCTISEGFDDITNLPDWAMINHSEPLGVTDWFQGNDAVFPSHSGAPTSYIGANFNNTSDGTISNWLLTPVVTIQNGSEITFWTRTVAGPSIFPDRLQIRASTAGDSTDVGTSSTDVGDFTHLLLDINPTYQPHGYPEDWTSFTATVSDVPTAMTGRFAFRYFVEDGGPDGANSNYIGIDDACVAAGAAAATASSAASAASASATTSAAATTSSSATSSASAATTSASAATTTTASAATSASGPLPCPESPRAASRRREDEDPAGALLGRQRATRSLAPLTARPCGQPVTEARHDQAPELPGQAGGRQRLERHS